MYVHLMCATTKTNVMRIPVYINRGGNTVFCKINLIIDYF